MTHRLIIETAEGYTNNGTFLSYVSPMPNTIVYSGKILVDALVPDNLDASGFTVVGRWAEDGSVITPLNEVKMTQHLQSGVLHEPHTWAGWVQVIS